MKPVLKWVGGKTQIIDDVLSSFPEKFGTYHEPFVGGGSVLLAVVEKYPNHKCVACDLNKNLINFYKQVQENPEDVVKFLEIFSKDFSDTKYYEIRKRYNDMKDELNPENAAMFLYLNKVGFRGLYRENKSGGFNVPYGHYKKPTIYEKDKIMEMSEKIKNVKFFVKDFRQSLKDVKSNDFVYLDPPYAPENETSFVAYTGTGFEAEDHTALFELTLKLPKFVMSNARVEKVTRFFTRPGITIDDITCRRAINSKNPGSTTTEVLLKKV